MSAPTDPSAVLRGFASGIPEPQQRWSRGEGLGGGTTTAEPKAEPKSEPKSEPKPTPTSTATGTTPDTDTKTEPKPAADTKTPDSPKPDTESEPKRLNPKVGKTLTQLGVPPSAVRNIRSGEPMKGVKGLAKGQWNAGQHWAGKLGNVAAKTVPTALGKGALKTAAKLIPGVGSLVAAYSAFHNFKQGDIVGGILNVVGAIPGPIGWIGIGASAIWEMSGLGDRYEEWQGPDGESTFMLMRDAKDVANVKEMDAKLRTAEANVFSFQDGPTRSVWDRTPPPALELSTSEVVAAATTWLNGISDHFAAIDKAMMNSGEQYFTEQRQSLTPHFTAMAALKGQVRALTDQLAAADKGGALAYKAVTGANADARGQLASSGKLTDAGPATTMETAMQKGLSAITARCGGRSNGDPRDGIVAARRADYVVIPTCTRNTGSPTH